jgi:hypothetical protein
MNGFLKRITSSARSIIKWLEIGGLRKMSKEQWLADQLHCMDDVFEEGKWCKHCKHCVHIDEDISGEGHRLSTRECEAQGDPDACIGVEEEFYDGMYAGEYYE